MEQLNELLKEAKNELEAVCQKYGVVLVPVVIHQGDRTVSSVEIVPLVAMQQQSADAQQQGSESTQA